MACANHGHEAHQDILRMHDVTVKYGRRIALEGVSAQIPCGGLVAVIGPNGAGKSTLLRCLLGWHPLVRGEIRVGDHHAHHVRPRFAYLPQRAEVNWDFPISVRQVVAQGRWPSLGYFRSLTEADHSLVERALKELGLAALANEQVRRLSAGQQQRMFLARALAQGADIFLLDEPFAGLDVGATEELLNLLRDWREQGRTVLVVLHDLALARRHFSHALLLKTRLVAAGTVAEVFTPAHLQYAFDGHAPLLEVQS